PSTSSFTYTTLFRSASYFVISFISGGLYQSWSDKLSLLKKEMAGRNIEMPEVVTNEEFIEQGSKALNMSISNFESQFNLKAESRSEEHTSELQSREN